jgi:cell division septum initiation protein DivIVA
MTGRRRQPLHVPVLLLACLTAVTLTGLVVQPAGAQQGSRPDRAEQPKLDELLDRFPIGTEPVQVAPPPAPASSRAPPGSPEATVVAEPRSSDGNRVLWLVLFTAASTLLVLSVSTGAIRWRRRRGSGTVSVSTSTLALFHQALAHANERSPRVTDLAKDRTSAEPASQESDVDRPSDPVGQQSDGQPPTRDRDYDGIGKRVIGILEAAEVAAAQIRADATETAAEIRKAAEAEAAVYLQKAERDAAKVRSDAEESARETRGTADAFVESERQEARDRAREIVTEAESRARALREAAEESVRQVEIAARERGEVLRAQVQPLEENLRRALDAFRGITGQLQELLDAQSALTEESLVETLNESARQVEASR